MSTQRVYRPKRYVHGSVTFAVNETSVDVWLVREEFAGRSRERERWFHLACSGPEATAIAKALVTLLDAQATDPTNLYSVLKSLGFSGPHREGQSDLFREPPT